MVGEWRAPDGLSGASFSPDGKFIVTSSWAKKAWVWDVGSKEMVSTLEGHAGRVNTAMFSPDGRNIVTASDDTTTRVWDANTGKEIVMLSRPHMDWINGASFSPDGELIITASQDKTARVWRWRDEEDRKTPVLLWEFTGGVNSAAFSSDGKYVVTVSRDNTAYIFPWVTFAPVPDLLQSVEKRFNRQLTSYECEYLHDRCQDYMRRTKSK
jgi:WD40 repeat protein